MPRSMCYRDTYGILHAAPDQAKEARQEREAHVAKAQMEAALARGVSWGMAEDARASDEEEVTHRLLTTTNTLTSSARQDVHGLHSSVHAQLTSTSPHVVTSPHPQTKA